jgi:hypothetical protein
MRRLGPKVKNVTTTRQYYKQPKISANQKCSFVKISQMLASGIRHTGLRKKIQGNKTKVCSYKNTMNLLSAGLKSALLAVKRGCCDLAPLSLRTCLQ